MDERDRDDCICLRCFHRKPEPQLRAYSAGEVQERQQDRWGGLVVVASPQATLPHVGLSATTILRPKPSVTFVLGLRGKRMERRKVTSESTWRSDLAPRRPVPDLPQPER
jgi:hypothetical protein